VQLSDADERCHASDDSDQSSYRSWVIPRSGATVYAPRHRAEWLAKIPQAGVRLRAERLYQQLDLLQPVRQEARRDLLRESHKHQAVKLRDRFPRSARFVPLCWWRCCRHPIVSVPSASCGLTVVSRSKSSRPPVEREVFFLTSLL
jgi:hypothetical protein